MITRDEFAKIVREMQAEGKPLNVRNLMVRTELPRAQIEAWLEDLQSGRAFVPKAKGSDEAKSEKKTRSRERDKDDDSIFSRAKALKDEVVGDVVKSQLGFGDDKPKKAKRSLITGALLGLFFLPAALAYAAPILEGILLTIVFAPLLWLGMKIPLLGTYIILALSLGGAALGAAYAWRFSRNGKRTNLLLSPWGSKKAKHRANDDEDEYDES